MTKRHVIDALKYVLGVGLLAYVIWKNWAPPGGGGLAAVWQRFVVQGQPINSMALAAAGALCAAAVIQTFVRWYVLVRAQGLPFTVPNALRLGFLGYFYNTLLPGSVGGDLVKAACIAREQDRRTVAVATVLIDRIVGLWALAWLVAGLGAGFWLAGAIDPGAKTACERIIISAAVIVAGSLAVWGLMGLLPAHRAERFAGRLGRVPLVGHSLAELWRAVWMFRVQGHAMWLALAMAVVGHVGFVLTFYFAALALQAAPDVPPVATHFLIIPIGMAVQAGIPTPGGVGGGEYVFGKLYQLIGYPAANGVLMTLVYRVITWVLGFVGYLVYLQMKPALRAVEAEASPADGDALRSASPEPVTTL